jgi:hypothetical protein
LEPNDYEVLLVVVGLAHYTRFGFAMKSTAWSKFLVCHRFASDDCEIKLDIKKIYLDAHIDGTPPSQLKGKNFYIVRIGTKSSDRPTRLRSRWVRMDD